jgi:hypothetical protein
LPDVGLWSPVTAPDGICADVDKTSGFQTTIHFGDRAGFLQVMVMSPGNRDARKPTCHGPWGEAAEGSPSPHPTGVFVSGIGSVTPGVLTCGDAPEGYLIVEDKRTDIRPGRRPIEDASATLIMKDGRSITALTIGGPEIEDGSQRPVGPEPYSGADLRSLVIALAHQVDSSS